MPIDRNAFDRFRDTDEATRAGLQTMGLAILQVAKPNCPVGKVNGGNLRRSHRMILDADKVDVGVTADYGGYVHNGTSRQKAQPWLKDAAQRNKSSIAQAGVDAYKGALR